MSIRYHEAIQQKIDFWQRQILKINNTIDGLESAKQILTMVDKQREEEKNNGR